MQITASLPCPAVLVDERLPSPLSIAEWDSYDIMSLGSGGLEIDYESGQLLIPEDLCGQLLNGSCEADEPTHQSRSNESSMCGETTMRFRLPGSPAPGEVLQSLHFGFPQV